MKSRGSKIDPSVFVRVRLFLGIDLGLKIGFVQYFLQNRSLVSVLVLDSFVGDFVEIVLLHKILFGFA